LKKSLCKGAKVWDHGFVERGTGQQTAGNGGKVWKAMSKWTVRNTYGIHGETTHRTPEAALKAAAKREGVGWIVEDENGRRWGQNGRGEAVIVDHAYGWY
jgi:hypothetical protein